MLYQEFLQTIKEAVKQQMPKDCMVSLNEVNQNNNQILDKHFMKEHSKSLRYLSLHKLRHSFASIANNTDIKILQETLGYSNASVTLILIVIGIWKRK